VIAQVRPIAIQYSLPQQQLARVNAALGKGQVPVDVFGNDGRSVVQTGTLEGVDNQVDPTTGTVKLKAVFANAELALWPGQFVNVRTKVDTLVQATVVPTASVQRGPAGTYAYVIGANDVVNARPISVTQQTDTEAVIASGLSPTDRVVTTGFANLAEGSRVLIGQDTQMPTPDLAPQQRRRQGGQSSQGGGQGRGPLNAGQKGSSEPGESSKGPQRGRPPEGGGAKQ
jgi:membrane fusion protein, multidrug efflux system